MPWRLFGIITSFSLLISFNLQATTVPYVTTSGFLKFDINNGNYITATGDIYNCSGCAVPEFYITYNNLRHDSAQTFATVKIFPIGLGNQIQIYGIADSTPGSNSSKPCNYYDQLWQSSYLCNLRVSTTSKGAAGTFFFYIKAVLDTRSSTPQTSSLPYSLVVCDCCSEAETNDSTSVCYGKSSGCPDLASDSKCRWPLTGLAAITNNSVSVNFVQTQELSFGTFISSQTTPCTIYSSSASQPIGDCQYLGGRGDGNFYITSSSALNTSALNTFVSFSTTNKLCAGVACMPFSLTAKNLSQGLSNKQPFTTFDVNGTLTVPPNQPPGHYTGTYTIIINY